MKTNRMQQDAAVLYSRAVEDEAGKIADLTASIIRAQMKGQTTGPAMRARAGVDEVPLDGIDGAVRLINEKHAAGLSDMDCYLAVHLGFKMFIAAESFGARWPHTSGKGGA